MAFDSFVPVGGLESTNRFMAQYIENKTKALETIRCFGCGSATPSQDAFDRE